MPAKSKAQQTAMRMALAARKGDLEVSKLKGAALDIYNSDMTNKEIEEFTVMENDLKIHLTNNLSNISIYISESILSSTNTGKYAIIDEWCKTHLNGTPYTINKHNLIEIKTSSVVINLDDKEVPNYIKFTPTVNRIYLNSTKSKKVDLSFLPSCCNELYLYIKADEISNLITKANVIHFKVDAKKYKNIVFSDNNNGYGCRLVVIGNGTDIKELKNMNLDNVCVLSVIDGTKMSLEFEKELGNKAPMNSRHYLNEPIGDEAKKIFDNIFGKDINKMALSAIRYCDKYDYYKRSNKWYKSKTSIL